MIENQIVIPISESKGRNQLILYLKIIFYVYDYQLKYNGQESKETTDLINLKIIKLVNNEYEINIEKLNLWLKNYGLKFENKSIQFLDNENLF